MNIRNTIAGVALVMSGIVAAAEQPDRNADCQADIAYSVSLSANAGKGEFAPYYIASNRHGTLTGSNGGQIRLSAFRVMDRKRRFSWGAGADIVGYAASATDYERYDAVSRTWSMNPQRPQPVWIQQLYGELKWRALFMTVGLKQHGSALLDNALASGDLVESGNARPIPEVRVGFLDFQDIPLTNGWLQLQGEIAYGKMTDNGWLRDHYNYYNHFLTLGTYYHYKRLYFRTRPSENLSVTLGMQAAGQFGGTINHYSAGEIWLTQSRPFHMRDLLDMFLTKNDESYYKGNHLGSWDLKARYRLSGGGEISAYFQWPWEDGSGIGKLNGFDGTWGLEWHKNSRGPVTGAVVELLYFMNHSGPLHWDPDDNVGSNVPGHTDGSDNYYNNVDYNGYANYGMCIGSPVFPGPLYNRDGYMAFVDNRLRGFHVGVTGALSSTMDYRVLAGYKEAFGTGYAPRKSPAHNTSAMAEATWRPSWLAGLRINAQVALDRGTIYGDQFGVSLGVTYSGALNFQRCK